MNGTPNGLVCHLLAYQMDWYASDWCPKRVGMPETYIFNFCVFCVVFVSKSIFSREKVCREREVGREIKFYYRKFRKFIVLVINPLLKYPIKIQNLNSIKFKFFNFINIKVLVCEKDSIFLKC